MNEGKVKSILKSVGNIMRGSCEIILNSPAWEVNDLWTIGINENIKIEKRRDLYE